MVLHQTAEAFRKRVMLTRKHRTHIHAKPHLRKRDVPIPDHGSQAAGLMSAKHHAGARSKQLVFQALRGTYVMCAVSTVHQSLYQVLAPKHQQIAHKASTCRQFAALMKPSVSGFITRDDSFELEFTSGEQ